MHQGRFRLDIRKISSWKGWSRIEIGHPGIWWSHHPWKCSRNVDVALEDMVCGEHGDGTGLTVGLDHLRYLFQGFNNPVILREGIAWPLCDTQQLKLLTLICQTT